MSTRIDCIVAGAGVVGLAIGRRLALAGLDVAVLDGEDRIGVHASSRNSEVIHAGIYYPPGSLKARLCVAGKRALYDYCQTKGISHSNVGKLIVATEASEESTLASIERRASANGVDDLHWLDAAAVTRIEPRVRATAALMSPSTGIIDCHGYMVSLQGDLEDAGGVLVLRSRITAVRPAGGEFDLTIDGDLRARCRLFVNAAGLGAPELAQKIEADSDLAPCSAFMARGHYFSYAGRSPFAHLVYPVPVDGGLGVHATRDLTGAVRFGPDVQWVDRVDYAFPDGLKDRFLAAVRRYFPGVERRRLRPSYTGIRPKLSGPGDPPADFVIDGPETHGVPGLVNLFGIESPGLTASPAIADYVHRLLKS